jgi:FAD/FMN-containing dehydrogenase
MAAARRSTGISFRGNLSGRRSEAKPQETERSGVMGDVHVGTGKVSVNGDKAIPGLRLGLRGEVLRPDTPGYEEARQVWNGTINKRPALIARCGGVADVIDAVNFGRIHGLRVSARGGGHHVAGSAVPDGGLLIDLSPMRSVHVDARPGTARAEGGARLGDLDRETQAFGLAAPAGLVSDTGIAGLTLAGGIGWLRRKYGLTSDNLVSVELITADGEFRRASETENPDLFWALRGGGWNLGVVTSFEYRAYPLGPEVMFTFVFYPASEAGQVLRLYRDYAATAPDEVSSMAVCGTIPDEPTFPRETHGEPFVLLAGLYAGSVEEGERILGPLQEFATPLVDLSGPRPYLEVQTIFDEDYPTGRRYYWKSAYLSDLGDDALDQIIEQAARRPSPLTTLDIWHLGGAISRVGKEETPVDHRDAPYLLGIESNWDDPRHDDDNVAWTREVARSMAPFSTGGSYLNFEDLDSDAVAAAHGSNYARLVEIKRKYDPDNLFGEK